MKDIEEVSCVRFKQYFNINDVKTPEYVLILAGNRYFSLFFIVHDYFFQETLESCHVTLFRIYIFTFLDAKRENQKQIEQFSNTRQVCKTNKNNLMF